MAKVTTTHLNIEGFRDQPVPNTLIQPDGGSGHLAVVLPGLAYRTNMPALYYPARVMLAHQADVLLVEYDYLRPGFRELNDEDQYRWVYADAEAALATALSAGNYQRLTLISKSLGAFGMGYLISNDFNLPRTDCIWLTPDLTNDLLVQQIIDGKRLSLVVMGSADPQHFSQAALTKLEQEGGVHPLLIDGADHLLEIPGDVNATLRGMQRIVKAMENFLGWGKSLQGSNWMWQ